jgi:hypothetical protein
MYEKLSGQPQLFAWSCAFGFDVGHLPLGSPTICSIRIQNNRLLSRDNERLDYRLCLRGKQSYGGFVDFLFLVSALLSETAGKNGRGVEFYAHNLTEDDMAQIFGWIMVAFLVAIFVPLAISPVIIGDYSIRRI